MSHQAALTAIRTVYQWCVALVVALPVVAQGESGGANRSVYAAADSLQRGLTLLEQKADGFALVRMLRDRIDGNIARLEPVLVEVASERGIGVKALGGLKLRDLSGLPGPAILRVLPSVDSDAADHYVLLEQIDGEQAVISTSRVTAQTVPLLDLAPLWRGDAVLLAALPADVDGFSPASGSGFRWPIGLTLILGAALFFVGLCWNETRGGAPSLSRVAKQGLVLPALVVAGAAVYAWGFAHDRVQTARADTEHVVQTFIDFRADQSPVQTYESHDLVREELVALMDGGDALWVDARSQEKYKIDSVAGAVLLERYDASTIRLRLAGIPRDTKLIVYCASITCGRGRAASAALSRAGFTQVVHYPPGWAELKNWAPLRGVNLE